MNKVSELQYVVFRLGDKNYAISIMEIQEIDRLKEIKINKVPNAPNYIMGIINLRGVVVPVIDLNVKFNLSKKTIEKSSRIIIVKWEKKDIGLLVDKVLYVLDSPESKVAAPPEDLRIKANYISGIVRHNAETIFILDTKKIFVLSSENSYSA